MKFKVVTLALFAVASMSSFAHADLNQEFRSRDAEYQNHRRDYDARTDRASKLFIKNIETAARSRWIPGQIEATLDGSVPQIWYAKMENGLVCRAQTIGDFYQLVAKVKCN